MAEQLRPGTVVTLNVEREAPFGYFLTNGEEDVLLHQSEISEGFDPEQELNVFLFQDHQGRLAATMTLPKIQVGTYDWASVVQVKRELGVFVDIGLNKDILVSKDDLPAIYEIWPEVGDELFLTLKTDKKDRLFGKLATEETIREVARPADRKAFNRNIVGHVYRLLKVGSFLLSVEGYIGFIHESQRKREPRLGERVEGRIIDVKEDGSVNVSLLPRKQESLKDDADILYEYMESRGGAMPFWDKSLPEDIQERFNMSKGAFKRALGTLMKEGKVYQEEGWTYFKKEE